MTDSPELSRALSTAEDSADRLLQADVEHETSSSGLDSKQDDEAHRKTCNLLYISHFLSAWNSRAFEFGAFLFLSTIYPQTLLPASVYALTRAGSAAVFSPWLGSYVDNAQRLEVVRSSIIGQRVSVAISCLILFGGSSYTNILQSQIYSAAFLILLCGFAMVEKLSAIVNTISIERDWVVVIAQDDETRLRTMNAQMRRIDLFCKLVGPLAISFIDARSTRAAIAATGAMTAASIGLEYFAIAKVFQAVPALHVPRISKYIQASSTQITAWNRLKTAMEGTIIYVQHRAFLPSFALALLYLTVLSFAGQMITYLLSLGMSPGTIGILRGIAAIFEMSATWLAPKIMESIGPIRAGIWFLNFQMLCVAAACLFLWLDVTPKIAAIGTVSAVIASRIGLWGFDLSAQIIVQEEVEAELRGVFSAQEFAFQNIFEMLSFASTIILSRPSQFKYPAALSAGAVAFAGVLYATFVRVRRGHLIHLSRCMERNQKSGRRHEWSRVPSENALDDNHELSNRP